MKLQNEELTGGSRRASRTLATISRRSTDGEAGIERYLRRLARERGGLCLKFASQTDAGFPDRLLIMPGGLCCWVELKSRGERPRPLQLMRHEWLRSLGQRVAVIDSREAASLLVSSMTRGRASGD